jgi:hypothetical protein
MIEKFSNIDTKSTNLDVSNNKLDTSKPLDFSRPDEVGGKLDNTKLDTSRAQDYSNDLERKETLEQLKQKYLEDLLAKTEYPETIDIEKAMKADFRKCSSEENRIAREEFNDLRSDLRDQWAEKNGIEWPLHKENVYNDKGILIKRAGDKYDAHHIQPLAMGGKNEVDNITPFNKNAHTELHKSSGPLSELGQYLK